MPKSITLAADLLPIHPAFTGKAKVSGALPDSVYRVDLDSWVCSCADGAAEYTFSDGKKTLNYACVHKLKALASIIEANGSPPDMIWEYVKLVGVQFNRFESISAFHKELRRGDIPHALYWANVIVTQRGLRGVVRYLRDIIYEETRDHELCADILAINRLSGKLEPKDVFRLVVRFCLAPKKWELPHRFDIFKDEMRGYLRLAYRFGYGVAKNDSISSLERDTLTAELINGFNKADRIQVQVGLKGLLKLQEDGSACEPRLYLFNLLCELFEKKRANKFNVDSDAVAGRIADCSAILDKGDALGYHYINALADALTGESKESGLTPKHRKRIAARYTALAVPLGVLWRIPKYAQDNHTWAGKAMMKKYFNELSPGAEQSHLDFRWCGAYHGVAWRQLAIKQYGTCDVKWGAVKWPSWLTQHTNRMWY